MKRVFLKFAALAIVALGSISIMSCEKGENEENDEIPTTEKSICETIEEIPIDDEELANRIITNLIDVYMGSDNCVEVNSRVEYDSLFPNCPLPKEVDFDNKTLYVVRRMLIRPFVSEEISCYYSFGGNYANIYIDVETDWEAESVYSNYLKVFTTDKTKENQKVFLSLNIDYEQPWF